MSLLSFPSTKHEDATDLENAVKIKPHFVIARWSEIAFRTRNCWVFFSFLSPPPNSSSSPTVAGTATHFLRRSLSAKPHFPESGNEGSF